MSNKIMIFFIFIHSFMNSNILCLCVDENVRGRYDKMCSVTSRCKGQKFMEREDPLVRNGQWQRCKTDMCVCC
jgi:hypothetical protein